MAATQPTHPGQEGSGDHDHMRCGLLAFLKLNPDSDGLLAWLRSCDKKKWMSLLARNNDLLLQVKQILGMDNPASASASDHFAGSAQVGARGCTCPLGWGPRSLKCLVSGCRYIRGT